jgi:hypothetical protein
VKPSLILKTFWALIFLAVSIGCSTADVKSGIIVCKDDPARQKARSKELQEIVNADQGERVNFQTMTPNQMLAMSQNDEVRRKRVGEIFGEGCFKTAQDYAAAALVFQHGTTPDHFYQTFIWSKRGVELGDKKQERMMALGIDRYLVNTGHKQLFASQATKPEQTAEACWCLQPVEKSFPEARRKEIADKSMPETISWVNSMNQGKNCPQTECVQDLKPTPAGTIPGFW